MSRCCRCRVGLTGTRLEPGKGGCTATVDDSRGCLTYLFAEVFDGRDVHLTDGVRRALGREPQDSRDYVREAAATGVWTPGGTRSAEPPKTVETEMSCGILGRAADPRRLNENGNRERRDG